MDYIGNSTKSRKGGITMKSKKHSIWLSLIFTGVIGVCLLAVAVCGPWLLALIGTRFSLGYMPFLRIVLTAYYLCLPFALLAVFVLFVLLLRILRGEVFVRSNIIAISILSWCCIVAAVITFAAAFFYIPFSLLTAAAVFIALILRVIKNVFDVAVSLKAENDLTI